MDNDPICRLHVFCRALTGPAPATRPPPTAMSESSVREFLSRHAPDVAIERAHQSTATVALAAEAFGVPPGRIAKTLAFKLADGAIVLLVARGDARIDNKKFKDAFGRGRMVSPEEVADITGHPVGGVCPFGLARDLPIWLDVSLQAFEEVLPAAGATDNAVRLSPARLAEITAGRWTDVCQPAPPSTAEAEAPAQAS